MADLDLEDLRALLGRLQAGLRETYAQLRAGRQAILITAEGCDDAALRARPETGNAAYQRGRAQGLRDALKILGLERDVAEEAPASD